MVDLAGPVQGLSMVEFIFIALKTKVPSSADLRHFLDPSVRTPDGSVTEWGRTPLVRTRGTSAKDHIQYSTSFSHLSAFLADLPLDGSIETDTTEPRSI